MAVWGWLIGLLAEARRRWRGLFKLICIGQVATELRNVVDGNHVDLLFFDLRFGQPLIEELGQ